MNFLTEKCEACGKVLTEGVARYSLMTYGKSLCLAHQEAEVNKTCRPKLASFLNDLNRKRYGYDREFMKEQEGLAVDFS